MSNTALGLGTINPARLGTAISRSGDGWAGSMTRFRYIQFGATLHVASMRGEPPTRCRDLWRSTLAGRPARGPLGRPRYRSHEKPLIRSYDDDQEARKAVGRAGPQETLFLPLTAFAVFLGSCTGGPAPVHVAQQLCSELSEPDEACWIELTDQTGCYVQIPAPHAADGDRAEIRTWTGECVEGLAQGTGTLEWGVPVLGDTQ